MAQINLLKQTSAGQNIWKALPKYLVWVFLAALVGFFAYYGWLFLQVKNIDTQAADVEKTIEANKTALSQIQNADELFTRETQLKNMSDLLSKHAYWSQLLPALAKVTLTKAQYSNVKISPDSTVSISVTVPSFEDFDKFLQVFDQPEVYKRFSNVFVDSLFESQTKGTAGVKFSIHMNFDPGLLKYTVQSPAN